MALRDDLDFAPLLCQLGAGPARQIQVAKDFDAPGELGFGPDYCIVGNRDRAWVHRLSEADPSEIPSWVKSSTAYLGEHQNESVLLLASTVDVAGSLIEEAAQLGFALACATSSGVHLILPPNYSRPTACCTADEEHGHLPSWVLTKLVDGPAFSTSLAKCISALVSEYTRRTERGPLSHVEESRLLYAFADCIRDHDKRLFFPTNRIHVLQEFEETHADSGARDHFFHTFNNLLLGFIVLGSLLDGRRKQQVPDRYIRCMKPDTLQPWEALWALTCLFHDPGYLAEKPYSTLNFALGLSHDPKRDPELPSELRRRLVDAWDTVFGDARRDLHELIKRVSDFIPKELGEDPVETFDSAIRTAYFDGQRSSHSLMSGLTLIARCSGDTTVKDAEYETRVAMTACEIAALSMMFHDTLCREKLKSAGVPPIPFEVLPYAATLMFVDALQDDRRDVSKGQFPKHGVLQSIEVDKAEAVVTANVCLLELPTSWWPYKIEEYESVLAWINGASEARFAIDYRSLARLNWSIQ